MSYLLLRSIFLMCIQNFFYIYNPLDHIKKYFFNVYTEFFFIYNPLDHNLCAGYFNLTPDLDFD